MVCILQPEEGEANAVVDVETGLCEFHSKNGRTARRSSLIAARRARFGMSDEANESTALRPLRVSAGDDPEAPMPLPPRDTWARASQKKHLDADPEGHTGEKERPAPDPTPPPPSPGPDPSPAPAPKPALEPLSGASLNTYIERVRSLPNRQARILRQCALGKTNGAIAEAIGSTEGSISVEMASIFKRLGMRDLPKSEKRQRAIEVANAAFNSEG